MGWLVYHVMLLVTLGLLITILIIFQLCAKQRILVFTHHLVKKYHYLCNSFIEVSSVTSISRLIQTLRQRISEVSLLERNPKEISDSGVADLEVHRLNSNTINQRELNPRLILIKTQVELDQELLTDELPISWRLLLYHRPRHRLLTLVFQNHRRLCGGQERVWEIINHLLDQPEKPQIKTNYSHPYPSLADVFHSIPTINTGKIMGFPPIVSTGLRTYSVQHYEQVEIARLCHATQSSINDFAIALVCYRVIQGGRLTDCYMNVFIPLYVDGGYCYYILSVPNRKQSLVELLKFVSEKTKKTIKNPWIKRINMYSTKIWSCLPTIVNCRLYHRVMERVHVFISNIHGFKQERSLTNYPVEQIYHLYHSYGRPVEAGVSSYNGQITITMNYLEGYLDPDRSLT